MLKYDQGSEKGYFYERMGKSKVSSENNPHEEKRKKSVTRKGKKGG